MSLGVPVIQTNIVKMVIVPLKGPDYTVLEKDKTFVVPINSESYSQRYENKYAEQTALGDQGTEPTYSCSPSDRYTLEFVLDGTGAAEGYVYSYLPVYLQIKLLLRTVYCLEKDIHRPNVVKIYHGPCFTFQGVLESLDINYTLFDKLGCPLRAKVNATFLESISKKICEKVANKQSPDLTKIREVKADDRFDLMTYKEYNDSKYVLQVAKANNLTSIRRVKTGRQLTFPPFDKTEV